MISSRYVLLYATASFGFFASCSDPSASVSSGRAPSSGGSESAFENQIYAEVNSYRVSKGKAALPRHPGLDHLARQHSKYLANNSGKYDLYGKNVSHIGFESRGLAARQAYRITSLGENVIASTDRSAKRYVNLWAESKGHEVNMRSDRGLTGVGSAVNPEGVVITTQIFGNIPSTSHTQMNDRFNRR